MKPVLNKRRKMDEREDVRGKKEPIKQEHTKNSMIGHKQRKKKEDIC